MPEKDKLVSYCCLLIDIGEISLLVTLQKFLWSVPSRFGGKRLNICSTNRTRLRQPQLNIRLSVRAKLKVFWTLKICRFIIPWLLLTVLLMSDCVFPWQLQEQERAWCHQTRHPAQCPCLLHECQMWTPLMQQLTCSSWESPCPWLVIGYRRQR